MRGRVIGILGGAFDPIHYGHLRIAATALETGLDSVYLIPSYAPPNKSPIASYQQRIDWAWRALEGLEGYKQGRLFVRDIEWSVPPPTYTYRLLMKLHLTFPEDRFCLILGQGEMDSFNNWARPELIKELAELFPMPRDNTDVSSTKIRELVRLGYSVGALTPIPLEELRAVYGS